MAILSALSLVVLMIAVTLDVTIRFTTGASLPGMVEVAESSLVVAVFFGIAWAGLHNDHVAVTLVTDHLGPRANRWISVAVWSLSALFLGWMTYATTLRAMNSTASLEERFGLVRWPMYPFRWVVAAGVAAFLLVALLNIWKALRNQSLDNREPDVESDAENPELHPDGMTS